MDEIDALTRALRWIDAQVERREVELTLLRAFRVLLTRIAGEDKPDGWAQTGTRAGED